MTEHKQCKCGELKPCPFCGWDARYEPNYGGTGIVAVLCLNPTCGAEVMGSGKEHAIELWNRRATDEQLAKAREALHHSSQLLENSLQAFGDEEGESAGMVLADCRDGIAQNRAVLALLGEEDHDT